MPTIAIEHSVGYFFAPLRNSYRDEGPVRQRGLRAGASGLWCGACELEGDTFVSHEGGTEAGGGVVKLGRDRVGLSVGSESGSSSEADDDGGDDEEGEDDESVPELSEESDAVVNLLRSARSAHSAQCSPASLGTRTMHLLW
jgi:hypothetical protein